MGYYKELSTLKNRYLRYLKSNLGKKNAFDKMVKLIEEKDFVYLQQAQTELDWKDASIMKF